MSSKLMNVLSDGLSIYMSIAVWHYSWRGEKRLRCVKLLVKIGYKPVKHTSS